MLTICGHSFMTTPPTSQLFHGSFGWIQKSLSLLTRVICKREAMAFIISHVHEDLKRWQSEEMIQEWCFYVFKNSSYVKEWQDEWRYKPECLSLGLLRPIWGERDAGVSKGVSHCVQVHSITTCQSWMFEAVLQPWDMTDTPLISL